MPRSRVDCELILTPMEVSVTKTALENDIVRLRTDTSIRASVRAVTVTELKGVLKKLEA